MIQQPSLFTDTPSRPRKRGHVPRSSVLAYRERPRDQRVARVLECIANTTSWVRYLTSAELAWEMFGRTDTDAVLYVRRGLSDALRDGLVAHAGQRECAVSGRTCLLWRTVGR
jgi:hypothetical protein